jgi:hypothetical protein
MKVIHAKFGFDERLKAAFYCKCKIGANEEGKAGIFGVQFAVIHPDPTPGRNALIALKDGKELLAMADPIIAVDWVKSVIAEKKYHWVHTYYSEVEHVSRQVNVIKLPFEVDGYTEVPEDAIKELEKALVLLQQP